MVRIRPVSATEGTGSVPGYAPSIRTLSATPRGGGLFWLLGFVVSGAILYYFFVYAPGAYTATQALLIALGAVFLGGALTRRGKRGAVVGFLVFFAPLMALGVLLLVGAAGAAGQAEGLEALGPVIGAVAGVMLLGLAFVAGLIGLVVAGIGGWIAGKIAPLGGRP